MSTSVKPIFSTKALKATSVDSPIRLYACFSAWNYQSWGLLMRNAMWIQLNLNGALSFWRQKLAACLLSTVLCSSWEAHPFWHSCGMTVDKTRNQHSCITDISPFIRLHITLLQEILALLTFIIVKRRCVAQCWASGNLRECCDVVLAHRPTFWVLYLPFWCKCASCTKLHLSIMTLTNCTILHLVLMWIAATGELIKEPRDDFLSGNRVENCGYWVIVSKLQGSCTLKSI